MDALTGLILAGGRSRRFGSDKSRFELPDGRGDMLQRGLALLSALPRVSRVAVSCREDQAEAIARRLPQGVELLIDPQHESSSPLFGVTAALRRWPGPVLLLSCDLPLMEAGTLRQLCDARDMARRGMGLPAALLPPLRTSFVHADGTVETLVSICEAESLPFLEAALTAGRLGLYAAIPADRQHLIPVRDSLPFFNMNTPQDAQRAASLLQDAQRAASLLQDAQREELL